jgi:hypothetical protein
MPIVSKVIPKIPASFIPKAYVIELVGAVVPRLVVFIDQFHEPVLPLGWHTLHQYTRPHEIRCPCETEEVVY